MDFSMIAPADLENILNCITTDEKKQDLLNVLYADDSTIDKSALLNFVQECLCPADGTNISQSIDLLEANHDVYTHFLAKLKDKLVSQIIDDLGKEYDPLIIESIDAFMFWSLYAIAIKKCIGAEHAGVKLSDSTYFDTISDILNDYQRQSHNECLRSFNMNTNTFTLRNTPDLRLFLHRFHSKNKSYKTRKKNLRRVEKRAKKIVQVYKLAHNGKSKLIFSNGRYLVPGQFANVIVKIYINK